MRYNVSDHLLWYNVPCELGNSYFICLFYVSSSNIRCKLCEYCQLYSLGLGLAVFIWESFNLDVPHLAFIHHSSVISLMDLCYHSSCFSSVADHKVANPPCLVIVSHPSLSHSFWDRFHPSCCWFSSSSLLIFCIPTPLIFKPFNYPSRLSVFIPSRQVSCIRYKCYVEDIDDLVFCPSCFAVILLYLFHNIL